MNKLQEQKLRRKIRQILKEVNAESNFAETRNGDRIEIGMFVTTASERNTSRPGKWRYKVVDIEPVGQYGPMYSSVTLSNGEVHSPSSLFWPSHNENK